MRGKLVLLYESETGKTLCDMASRVLTETAVSFRHTVTLPFKRCPASRELADAVVEQCMDAAGVLCGDSAMQCLPALTEEMRCLCRVRELRYAGLIENRSLAGKPLDIVVIQALDAAPDALSAAVQQARAISARDGLPVLQTPPTGRLAEDWQTALQEAEADGNALHAREAALADVIPEMIYHPSRLGAILCPPYAGGILSRAAAALSGAEGLCYDEYVGGVCPLLAPLGRQGEAVNPFGMLRAVYRLLALLGLEREAACVEAAVRNVLQAGWRTADMMQNEQTLREADELTELVCRQIEVAGEWITNG